MLPCLSGFWKLKRWLESSPLARHIGDLHLDMSSRPLRLESAEVSSSRANALLFRTLRPTSARVHLADTHEVYYASMYSAPATARQLTGT
jgi:hypothetical protein